MKYTRETIGNHPYFTYSQGPKNRNEYDLHFEEGEVEGDIDASDLNVKFFDTLFEPWNTSFDVEIFLEYQYANTAYPKKDFLNHTRRVVFECKKVYFPQGFDEQQNDIQQRVFKWINHKLDSIDSSSEDAKASIHLSDSQLTQLVKSFFQSLGARENIDILPAEVAKLLHAITGKKLGKKGIQYSTFYTHYMKGLRNSPPKNLQDLRIVEHELQRVELEAPLIRIQKEIDTQIEKIEYVKSLKTNRLKK